MILGSTNSGLLPVLQQEVNERSYRNHEQGLTASIAAGVIVAASMLVVASVSLKCGAASCSRSSPKRSATSPFLALLFPANGGKVLCSDPTMWADGRLNQRAALAAAAC